MLMEGSDGFRYSGGLGANDRHPGDWVVVDVAYNATR
jgi:hypothetical protein